jgi:hypothetical protein
MRGTVVALSAVMLLVGAVPALADPAGEQAMAARIDTLLVEAWTREKVEPANNSSDAEFLRRAWLDLCGIIPPINDPDGISGIRNFLDSKDEGKRQKLIERLLAKPTHAAHFANVWKNVLLPADANVQQFGGDIGFEAWLRGQFADNVPYDKLIADLVLAKGQANQTGPALFFTALQLKPEELAASTSRVFLGTQIQCAQCHDHPFDHWKRKDFWGYAAFFARLQQPPPQQQIAFQVVDADQGEVKLPGSEETIAPRFLGGDESGEKVGQSRREQLAAWLTWPENPYVARAAVNRVWALLFGRGIVQPVDDLGIHNPPSHPQLLDELAAYFVRTGYDVNCLVRTLTATRAYQLSSQANPLPSPLVGEGPGVRGQVEERPELFARMAIKSLTAEQLYDCLIEAMRRREANVQGQGQFAAFNRNFDQNRQAFLARFRAPTQGATEYQSGIPQALTLMNGANIRQATDLGQSDLLVALEAPFFTNQRRVEVLFLSTISRQPTDEERTKFVAYVEQGGTNNSSKQALGDVLWALLNSAEFVLNH